jgi:cell division control protein 7
MLSFDDFQVLDPLGTGAFSNVYLVHSKKTQKQYVLKEFFWNVSPSQIVREVEILHKFHHPNVSSVVTLLRSENRMAILLPYYHSIYFRPLLDVITNSQVVSYMQLLLRGLAEIHKQGIIHRDIKPSNVLFDPDKNHAVIIDFGFSCAISNDDPELPLNDNYEQDLNDPSMSQADCPMPSRRAGTRGFRAPEVLVGALRQTPALDIWSAGVLFLSILTQRYPFFVGENDLTNLCEIAVIFGARRVREAMLECDRMVRFPTSIAEEGMALVDLVAALNPTIREKGINSSACDLLGQMLDPCPTTRITAEQALAHGFFTP